MKHDILMKVKNAFKYLTLSWALLMLILYLIVLFEIPVFRWLSILPFMESVLDSWVLVLYLGIWAVPVLYIVTVILMMWVKEKIPEAKRQTTDVLTVILPIILCALMLLTNFNELLS